MLWTHRAERADRLVEGLAAVLLRPLNDPLTPEVVAVPTRGVERWLGQRLSGWLGASAGGGGSGGGGSGDGVCANVEFPFPGTLVGGAVAAATGIDAATDPWRPERSCWPLLEVVEARLDQDWLAPLAAHLGGAGAEADDHRRARRLTAARHVADLFDGYGVHRPAMMQDWAAGRDLDGRGGQVPEDAAWQPPLWRALRNRIGLASPAERLAEACERLRAEPTLSGLPDRLSLFGLTRLPASYLDVLHALASAREVHLFLLHPSPALWDRVGKLADRPRSVVPRSEDGTAALPSHPLLATWGRDAREMQLVLTGGGHPAIEEHLPLDVEPVTLLQRIQAGVRANQAPPGEPLSDRPAEDARSLLDPGDRSLQVHACHGRARQVEVVRDAVLHLLAADRTLEPRDVIVMCPDIESFAPLIHATFGLGDDGDTGVGPDGVAGAAGKAGPPSLRVRLADRSLRQTNPVLGVVAELLSLAASRVTASHVVDLASREPVRRRFGLDDDDLARIEEWVASAGVRWGLDAAHRAPFGLASVDANTWRAGLDRVLLGVAMAEEGERLVGGVLPLDDVDSGDIDLAGRLAELVDRLQGALAGLAGPQPLVAWVDAITAGADALTATSDADAWQRGQLRRLLDDVQREAATLGPAGADLVLAEVQALLADRLRGRPTTANFRTGHLTMCTLVPMRSVPHRVVCLLGLDDGVFPRRTAVDGDDLVQHDPCVGDRDARSEDRQLLLDALMAATDHLVITYTGRDERTNAVRPPAVPVGELLDVVDRTVQADGTGRARHRVVTTHPLQPFDLRNFTAGQLLPGRPWSFDPVALAGATASVGERRPAPPFLAGPLPPVATDVVQLEDLIRFAQHPVRAFLRQRLGVVVTKEQDDPADGLPVEPDPLEKWGVGQRMLEARLAGVGAGTARAAEVARGGLPPGALAGPLLEEIAGGVEGIVGAAPLAGASPPASVEVVAELGDGRTLVGTVPDVAGDEVRSVFYSRVAAKHRLAAWVRLLAVTAAYPERPFSALTVGRGQGKGKVSVTRIKALAPDATARRAAALAGLAVLVDLHRRGLREPLPLYCRTSGAYAAAVALGRDGLFAARKEWTTDWEFAQEDDEPEHRLVLGDRVVLERLFDAPPREDEGGPGWCEDEPSRFGRFARRLWDPLLAVEERSQ
ncbi:MAG: exodeoxyribonuclease V subunit gamma [Acidimicrobiales bacterium]